MVLHFLVWITLQVYEKVTLIPYISHSFVLYEPDASQTFSLDWMGLTSLAADSTWVMQAAMLVLAHEHEDRGAVEAPISVSFL